MSSKKGAQAPDAGAVQNASLKRAERECITFKRTGHCKFGAKCRYVHRPSAPPKPQETLLEKLTRDVVHKERLATLQCLRFLMDEFIRDDT